MRPILAGAICVAVKRWDQGHLPNILIAGLLLIALVWWLVRRLVKLIQELEDEKAIVGWAVMLLCWLLNYFQEQDAKVPASTRLNYRPKGWLRVCAQWDARGNRFLVSFMEGGMGALAYRAGSYSEEVVLVPQPPLPGLSNLGFCIDYPRNRVVSCASDKKHNLLSSIVAYDYTTWDTIFFLKLAGPETRSLANLLTIDPEGDIYVSDTYNAWIWKVKSDGSKFKIFSDSPLYKLKPVGRFYNAAKLCGILYHPNGFLLVVHMGAHALFKVSMDGKDVRRVQGLKGSLLGEGIVLVNSNKMAMAGMHLGVHLLETKDDWESAIVTHNCSPPLQRLAASVALKDGDVFISFVNGFGIPYTSTIGQAVFKPIGNL